jgi:hypothetical protein
MTLTDDEITDLRYVLGCFRLLTATTDEVVAHVTELCAAYHAQGLVMGDLGHDGTVQWEAGAE